MLHDPVHSCLNAGVIAEMHTLDAGVTREAHVHQLTNDRLVHVNSYLPSNSQSIQTYTLLAGCIRLQKYMC